MKAENEPREGSYEASLTNDDRAVLHSLLISGESLHEAREKAPLWGKGPEQGTKPSIATLWKIQRRLRTEEVMCGLEGSLETAQASRRPLAKVAKDSNQELILDAALTMIGQKVLVRSMGGRDLTMQKNIAKLLLKRADQRLCDRRMNLLEGKDEE